MEVKIVNFPATKVAVLEHHGSPALKHESIKKLIAWRIENKLPPEKHKSYGVHYNNPETTPPDEYRVDLCISTNRDVPPNSQGVINKVIPAGRCAVIRHIGSRNNVTAVAYLYEQWLPQSGEKLRDYPVFFHYVNVGKDIQEQDMITDVYLPLL
ncbi:AraC family transcriptional regulator [Bathymodiolus thermophilus thioautotrophic gill symbiont]|uniref:AraC effector-binding domain-containing protein n=1 Tax=Bathymodiolus thermophilus thioautotrophic gill symbiont TaxID=2360 RepID=A0A1J5UFX1_9GAMM|nr:GyrI-like domain-containing protein [Bathymodiolus thermophilus thioautotrophic gill symbiont]OIR24813.1 hypothetical protein BGC33_14890 [Bathymodiolus thermophilus thioautotrophic gill symbiont]